MIVREPCGRQIPSANSHSCPLAALLLGQAIGPVVPSVSAWRHWPVVGLHGPSPALFAPPSLLPMHVSKTLPSCRPLVLNGSWLESDEQTSLCPISCSMSTPPSSADHGTWFCCAAVAYSAWNVNGEPAQVFRFVFMNPLAALAVMKPVLCVVRSVTVAVKPDDGSLIAIFSWSPELTANVLAFGVNVLPL